MRAEQAWGAMRALPMLDFAKAFGDAPILVLAPHPDDESLGCGGLIAQACAIGRPPMVAILTDGAGSHPNSRAFPPERLRALREQETLQALGHLGLPGERVAFLRYPDTAAPNAGAPLHAAAARLADLIRAWECRMVVTAWRYDPHCDHEAAADIAAAACRATIARLLAFPVWGWTLPPGQEIEQAPFGGFRLDVSAQLDRKRAAILAHRSQHAGVITDDPGGFQMATSFIDRFLQPSETYIDVETTP